MAEVKLTAQEEEDIDQLLERPFIAGSGFTSESELPESDTDENPEEDE